MADKIAKILEWVEYNEFLAQYYWIGIFLAAGIIGFCLWKWLTRDVG